MRFVDEQTNEFEISKTGILKDSILKIFKANKATSFNRLGSFFTFTTNWVWFAVRLWIESNISKIEGKFFLSSFSSSLYRFYCSRIKIKLFMLDFWRRINVSIRFKPRTRMYPIEPVPQLLALLKPFSIRNGKAVESLIPLSLTSDIIYRQFCLWLKFRFDWVWVKIWEVWVCWDLLNG